MLYQPAGRARCANNRGRHGRGHHRKETDGLGAAPPGHHRRADPEQQPQAFFECANQAFDNACAQGAPLAFLLLDIDDFKDVNDSYGHLEGDQVLRRIAESGRGVLRRGDLFGRIGGEEFAAVLPGCAPEMAMQVAERLGKEIQALSFSCEGRAFTVTVSQGLANLCEDDSTLDSLFARADTAMYEAKRQGKNRVVAG